MAAAARLLEKKNSLVRWLLPVTEYTPTPLFPPFNNRSKINSPLPASYSRTRVKTIKKIIKKNCTPASMPVKKILHNAIG
jgi:hypothetical protein